MRSNDDPLEGWLLVDVSEVLTQELARLQMALHGGLDELERWFDDPSPGKRRNMGDVRFMSWNGMVGFAPADVPRAQALYWRVLETGGTGSRYVQEELLQNLAGAEDQGSVDFWVALSDVQRPRDRFNSRRRTLAVAALARQVARHDTPEALAALRGLAQHANLDVRAEAVYYLGAAYLMVERPLPPDLAAQITTIATEDSAFGPRFQARSVLSLAELPVPLDNPGGAYELRVRLSWAPKAYRTIAVRSENTLEDLHYAIQGAFRWDADHLYSFFMNGQLYDDRYGFVSPPEDDALRWADEGIIGELGLNLGHKFLYFFDYGDSHQFSIEVVAIHPQAGKGKYPRVTESAGRAPEQYRNWDEEMG